MEQYNNGNYQNQNGWQNQGGWQNQNGAGYQAGGVWNMTTAQQAVKDGGSSVCFLIGIICYTVSVLLSIYMGLSGETFDLEGPFILIYLLVMIPTALVCIGLWIFYTGCRKDGAPASNGLSLIKGGWITSLVLLIIACVIGALAVFIAFSEANRETGGMLRYYLRYSGFYSSDEGISVIIMLILIVVLLVIFFIYMVKVLKTLGAVISICRTGWPDRKLSMYVIVLNFIVAGFVCLSIIVSLMTMNRMINFSFITVIQELVSLAALLCITISVIGLRGRLISGR